MVESDLSSNLGFTIVSTPPVKPVGGNSGKEDTLGNRRRAARSRQTKEDEGDYTEVPEIPAHQIDKLA
jgi:hypothetical protein